MKLTYKERDRIMDGTIERTEGSLLRPIEQWQEILASEPTPFDAAARILGDIVCFQSDRGAVRRHGAISDVMQLAHALDAWAVLKKGE